MASQNKPELLCKSLPIEVKDTFRSRVVISNVVRCVEELVLNSIDAGATGVNVSVNLDYFRVKVEDNGNGISKEDLKVLGSRYLTSKCQSLADLVDLKTYGFRGESLARIIEVASTVELISKSKTSTTGHVYRRKFKRGKAGDVLMVSDDVIKFNGSIAIVDGLFEKQPEERQKIDKQTELNGIKSCLESISFVNPTLSISFRDDTTGISLFRTIVASTMMDYFKKICQRKQNVTEQRLMEIIFTQDNYYVSGCISQDWHPTKSLQYVYINKRIVADSKVNKMMSQQLACLFEYNDNSSNSQQFSQESEPRVKLTAKKKNSSRTAGPAEKFPVFLVNFSCSPSQVEMIYESSKTLANFVSDEDLTELIATLVRQVEDDIKLSKQNRVPNDKKSLPQKPPVVTEDNNSKVERSSNKLGKRRMTSGNSADISVPKPVLAREITVHDMKRVIHSRPAVREKKDATHQDDGEVPVAKKVCHNNDVRNIIRMVQEREQQSSTTSDVNDSVANEVSNNVQDLVEIPLQETPGDRAQDEVLPTRRREKRRHHDHDYVRAPSGKRSKRSTGSKKPKPKRMTKRKGLMTYLFPAFKATAAVPSSVEGTPIRRSEIDVNDLNMSNVFNRSCSVSEDSPNSLLDGCEDNKHGYALRAIRKAALYFMCEKYVVPDYSRIISKRLNKIIQEHPSYEHLKNVLQHENSMVEAVTTNKARPVANNNTGKGKENILESHDNNASIPIDPEPFPSLLHRPVLDLSPVNEFFSPKSPVFNDPPHDCVVQDNGGSSYFSSSSLAAANIGTSRWAGNFSTGTVLRNLFPSTSKSFWDSTKQKEGLNKIDRMGNINMLQNEEIMIGDAVRSGLGGGVEDDFVTRKWQENCIQERGKYFRTSSGEPMEVDQREGHDWNALLRVGLSEMPVANDNAAKMNMWRKKVSTSLPVPCQFTKDDLSRTVVIGNVERKFIAAKITMIQTYAFAEIKETEMLVLFDQHAVHERICLERLIDGSLQERIHGERTVVSVDIYPPLQMNFTGSEVRVMVSNKRAFGLVGLKFEIVGPYTVKFYAGPKCFAERVAKEPMLNKDKTAQRLLQSLVRDQVDYIMQTNGAVQTLPNTIMDVLRSQACRGAIKFGDELSLEDCVNLINDLKTCQAPFQCAHGRPVLVPLADLKEVQRFF